ncbi:hypothetical protein NL526_30485, partial [Klebsiella pneumoniae]|nr:hypothetical protein [Klebsiella pneumoniae]
SVFVLELESGSVVRKWGSHGGSECLFAGSYGIAVNGTEVAVVDSGNHRVQVSLLLFCCSCLFSHALFVA